MKKVLLFILLSCLANVVSGKGQRIELGENLGTAELFMPEPGQQTGSAMIVVHEWWGLNDYAKERAAMLAAEGVPAIAVDMYGHGKVAAHPDNAQEFMQAAFAEPDKLNARFNAAKKLLMQQSGLPAEQIYAMGYCFGGAVVLNQARSGNVLGGVISFHGSLGTKNPAKPGDVKTRILVAHGGSDPFVPAEQLSGFINEMSAAKVDFQLMNFADAKHSFTVKDAGVKGEKFNMPLEYNAYADKASWEAMLAFIRTQ